MRMDCRWLGAALVLTAAAPAVGGLVVTSYRTVAQTNGYAPVSQAQYFAEQRLENVSPAHAQVSGDWTGPNADGTPNTWHFVGTSRATSTTTITADSYTVEAAASFAYELNTTSAFIDPASVSVFAPGTVASYRGFFEANVPIEYTITARLHQRGRVTLISSNGIVIFTRTNSDVLPEFINVGGTLPPGSFNILATAGSGVPNLSSGVHHRIGSGSFEDFVFTARIPEPGSLAFGTVLVILAKRRRNR